MPDPTAAAALTNGQQREQQQLQATTAARRERRPDRAVYIPRARRSQTTPPTTTTTQQQVATSTTTTTTSTTSNNASNQQQLAITSDTNALVSVAPTTSTKTDELLLYKNSLPSTKSKSKSSASATSACNKERKDRVKKSTATAAKNNIKLPESEPESLQKQQQLEQSPETTLLLNLPAKNQNQVEYSKDLSLHLNCDNVGGYQAQTAFCSELTTQVSLSEPPPEELSIDAHIIATNTMNSANCVINNGSSKKPLRPNSVVLDSVASAPSNLLIEDVVASSEKSVRRSSRKHAQPKCDNDVQELQRASKEINRSNRRIIKQTFVSDVLEIPEKIETKSNAVTTQFTPTKRSKVFDSADEDTTEEDDWETMFDESGDCLDPKIIQELTASVGKVKIELPKMDYSAYLTKQSILNDEEFPHVLEVSNFPVEFKNQDLLMVFSQYKESGFDIKWVDDTHALAVFSSSQIAAEVLTMGHPFVVLKPLAEATVESRLKAKKCATSLQPYRPRPATCAALARRLVTGALGVRLKTAAAERENEIRVLREAKERKLLAAKQRDEVWES